MLFEGGPATGPWQQLGTVAEITHPDAPETARYSYTNFWSDPNEENQSDELWDELVAVVIDELLSLGNPLNRPAFDGGDGSEPFNSFGGVQDIYPDDAALTTYWSGAFSDGDRAGRAYVWFLVGFDSRVIDQSEPLIIWESPGRTVQENEADNVGGMRLWAAERGYINCTGC